MRAAVSEFHEYQPFPNSVSVCPGVHRWFALTVKPRHDKAVSHALAAKGYETLVPTYTKRNRYAARVKESELPLFPGYVFCRLDPMARLPILLTPGVIQILGAGRVPIPVDETEIASLRSAINANVPLQPSPFFQAGQRVRIAEGSLAGVEGTVMSTRQGPRLVLSITLLQRSVQLEIDCDRVRLEGVGARRV
jgi:transcription antitermination factor NusG